MASQVQCTICGKSKAVENPPSAARYVCPDCSNQTIADVSARSDPTHTDRPTSKSKQDGTISDGDGASLPDDQMMARFGNYEIIDELSRGGVGIVYRARQKGLNRIVALKVLQGGTSARADQVQRFFYEAQSAAKLQHPNIVPIHEFGTHEGLHYFTMDFIEGQSLADLMASGPLQPREALEIVKQTTAALHYAHEQGIVHRDIKPGNILLDKEGRVKITDFGLAKEISREDMHLTMEGQVMGTPRYMSPEQATGRTSQADARSDIFSMGVTLYEMLTGRPAFGSDNVIQMLQQVIAEDPPRPHKLNRKVHRDIETICLKAMEKVPDRRYQTALEMTDDIDRFLGGEPIEAKPASLLYYAGRRLRKHWKALALYAVVLYATIHGVILYLNSRPSALHLSVETPGALVAVDHSALSDSEIQSGLSLKAGAHEILIENEPLYDPKQISISTKPGESRTMSVALPRRKGSLAITTDPPDIGVTVAGGDGFHATFQGPTIQQELPTGRYTLFAHKDNFLAQELEVNVAAHQTQTLLFSLPSITLWAAQTSGNVMSVPVVADLDGDGIGDVIAGDDDGRIYCLSGRNGIPLWVFRAHDAVQAPLSMADVNHDGTPDIIVGSTDHNVYCIDGKTGRALWTFETHGAIYGPALLNDVNGDGVPDAFVGSDDGNLYAISGADGALLWKFRAVGRINSSVAWARDAGEDVLLVGSLDHNLYCLQPKTGELLWKVDVGAPLYYPARIEDLEQNGKMAALLPTPQAVGDVRTYTAVSLADRKVVGTSAEFPLWVDLSGDGKPEKIVVGEKSTTCFAHDGVTQLWKTDYLVVTPHMADVNGDGVLDLIFNYGPDQLVCLSGHDGSEIGRIKLDAATGRGYALDDIDRDGTPDLVVGAGRKINCFSWVGGRKRWANNAATYFDAPFAVENGRVFTKSIGGEIAAYDPERNDPIWKVQTSAQPSPYVGVTAGQGVVVDADAKTRWLSAYRASDGGVLWQARLPGDADAAIGAPIIGQGVVVVGDGATGFHAFSLATGTQRWATAVAEVVAPAAVDKDFAFVGDGKGALHCLSLADGKELWQFPVSDPFPSAPALVDINGDGRNDVVAVSDNGFVYAIDGKTGKELWDYQFSATRSRTHNGIALADVDGDGFPEGVVVNPKGDIVCLDLKTGKPKWNGILGELVMSAPAIADMNGDGVPDVLVGTMGRRVHCISGKGDRQLWSYEVGSQIRYCVPALVRGANAKGAPEVFVGTGPPENGLYCLSGDSPRRHDRGWFGPWKELTAVRR
ncbi:MAG TPA: PQQ-binding-like beta-propeller repeat protein [Verrucomicrobiae bacterium]|nr:PQQ-binding-like beta-propeller repeat protein [Verrucomicrobiae bacterium]